jgi:hypothetical protein
VISYSIEKRLCKIESHYDGLPLISQALKLNFSVFFADMDVYLAQNPLPWLMSIFEDADMANSSESCVPWASFSGDYIRWKPDQVFAQNIGQVSLHTKKH